MGRMNLAEAGLAATLAGGMERDPIQMDRITPGSTRF
jgi:hypothetical protein